MHTLKSTTDNTSIKVPILQTIVTTVFTFMLVLVKPPVCRRHNLGHIIMLQVLLVFVAEQDMQKPVGKQLNKLKLNKLQTMKVDKLKRQHLKTQLLCLMKQGMLSAPVMML